MGQGGDRLDDPGVNGRVAHDAAVTDLVATGFELRLR
jgi:hypothetical protein